MTAERRIKEGGEGAGKVKYTLKVSKLECRIKEVDKRRKKKIFCH